MKQLFAILTLVFIAASCTRESLVSPYDDFVEGEKAAIHIALKDVKMNVVTRAELTSAQEEEIRSVAIFIIDNPTNQVVTSVFQARVDEQNYPADDLPVETLVGNDRSVYVIANYDTNLIPNLKTAATRQDVENLLANEYSNPLLYEYGLAKSGKIASTNIRKNTRVTVQLEYITAKITTNVINKSPDFTVSGWGISNIPTCTYAFPSTTDAHSDADYNYDFEGQVINFEKETPDTPSAGNITYSNTFYLFENRRGGRDSGKPAPPDGWPYGSSTDSRQPYQEKTWYAPKNATCIKIYGKWIDNKTPRDVVITHYLGANNVDDYNIARGTHYTYNITIEKLNTSGNLNNIKIDTNVEMKESYIQVIAPAQMLNLDAHYCYRPITINVQQMKESGAKISIEVLESANSSVYSKWLDLSATALFTHHVRDDGHNYGIDPNLAINTWLQNGTQWRYARPKFVPNMDDRKAGGIAAGYTPPGTLTIDYTNSNPANILPDNDNVMEYKPQNYHRMVKKYTSLPTGAIDDPKKSSDPVNIILYAKEYPVSELNNPLAAAYREAVVRITLERAGHSPEYTHYTVRQYPPYLFARIPNDARNGYDLLLVERVEEFSLPLHPAMDGNLQALNGMQWGDWNIGGTAATGINATNGFNSTLLGVYNTATNTPATNTANDYRLPLYGSLQGGWQKGNNGRIEQGLSGDFGSALTGQPYFNVPQTNYNNAVNISNNTTAARYCHEKNWDENGDGIIAGAEVKWYLPSTAEVQLFWTYHEILNLKPEYYWSSNQADANNAYAHSMSQAQSNPNLQYSGIQQIYPKKLISGQKPPRVRCVRRIAESLITQNSPTAPLVYHTSTASIVDCSPLPGSMITTQSKMGLEQGNPGALKIANERIYRKFEVQRIQSGTAANYVELYLNNKCDRTQNWRLPTQRELLILYSVRDRLEADARFNKFLNQTYWSMTAGLSHQYLIEFGNNGLARISNASTAPFPTYYYRCVRELN